MATKKVQELEALIAQRDSEIVNLKQYIQAISKQLEEYQQKERAIGLALTDAQTSAIARVEEAEQHALGIVANAEQKRDEMLMEAEKERNEASEQAAQILKEAQVEAVFRVQQTEQAVADYERRLKGMNARLSELAQKVQKESDEFARFLLENEVAPDREFLSSAPSAETVKEQFAPAGVEDILVAGEEAAEEAAENASEAAEQAPAFASMADEAAEIDKEAALFTPEAAEKAQDVIDAAPEAAEQAQEAAENMQAVTPIASEEAARAEERVWTVDEIVDTAQQEAEADADDGLDQLLDEILKGK